MSEVYLTLLALILAFWCLWLERKVRMMLDDYDVLMHVFHGIARGTHSVEIINGRVKVHVKGVD